MTLVTMPKQFYVFMARQVGVKEWHLSAEAKTDHPDQETLMQGVDAVRVIEYSAYNQAIYELDKARVDRDQALKERDLYLDKLERFQQTRV